MDEQEFSRALNEAYRAREQDAPGFDAAWQAAGKRHRAARIRRVASASVAAAVLVAAISFGLRTADETPQEYLTLAALTESTNWRAPSDVLLPARTVDLYADLPVLMESTELE